MGTSVSCDVVCRDINGNCFFVGWAMSGVSENLSLKVRRDLSEGRIITIDVEPCDIVSKGTIIFVHNGDYYEKHEVVSFDYPSKVFITKEEDSGIQSLVPISEAFARVTPI